MSLFTIAILLLLNTASHAAENTAFPDLNLKDPGSLQEATRVLEEEINLAARPQTYLLIDLVAHTIHIKGRGVDLHRIPIIAWSLKIPEAIKGTHRLITRPPIQRRKIDPTSSLEQQPISLADMPMDYTLSFTPALTIDVSPALEDHPFQWIVARGTSWWRQFNAWLASLFTDQSPPSSPALTLEISSEQAQSLAWSVVDGMPLIIRRPATTHK